MSTSTPHTTDQPAVEKTRWRIDPTRSRIEFRTPTFWGLITVENHPQVRFISDSARLDGERLTVSGRLYAAGRVRRLTGTPDCDASTAS